MKINIGIDLERLRNPNSGLGQFCKYLGENLQDIQQEQANFHFYYPKQYTDIIIGAQPHTVSFFDKLLGVNNKELQLFHCTHQDSHLFPKNTATILTIHDLNFLEKYSSVSKQQQKLKALQQKVNKAKGLTFISQFTKQLAQQHLQFPDVPAEVIYNGNCLNTNATPKKPNTSITGEFLFSIGIVNPKKNFHVLLPLIKHSNYSLVIAGNNTHAYAQEIKTQAAQMGISDRVILLGAVTENEKHWLYQNCKAFVFPSLAEGFGLPVIEAMSLGKPVFLSNKTSLPEVGGELAYYWNNFESNNMVEVLKKGLADFENSPTKNQYLKNWAQQFNWKKTAEDYLKFYSKVYNAL